jgi:HlyD family secretion protein
MTAPTEDKLSALAIPAHKKARRKSGPVILLILIVLVVVVIGAVFFITRKNAAASGAAKGKASTDTAAVGAPAVPVAPRKPGEPVLTVSGYIIPRQRIEISPKFMGTVKWIGVQKGDRVKKGDILVQLEDDEYRARLLEAQGRLAVAEANLVNADLNLKRQLELASENIESKRALDDARRAFDAATAEVMAAKGQLALAQTYLDWCTIRAPIDGTILEKLVDPNELVVPQSFGGSRGPSTAFVAMADLNDLQVEIDLNEADTPKVHLKQRCRVSPEAYPEKIYNGYVAELAPEANRQKGTLQVKVQVENPDNFLTPELTAKVEFLAD